jgi:hypothetical protein
MVTPTNDIPSLQDMTAHRLPPLNVHRTNIAHVSQWRLDTVVTGQPASYGFLCALLFLRDSNFSGLSIDSQSGSLVEVGIAERNLPADI